LITTPKVTAAQHAAPRDARAADGGFAQLLRIPLFSKLFLANAAIVALVATAGGLLAVRVAGGTGTVALTWLAVAGAGIAISLVANALIVWVALKPLRELEATADVVRGGNMAARAPTSPLADAELSRLSSTFNAVLDTAEDRAHRLRELAIRAGMAAEEERKRLAGELHDGVAQTLAALNIRIRLARATADPQLRESVLDEVSGGIADVILELRRMARGLRPPALEMLGLAAAIRSHAQAVAEAAGIDLTIEAETVAGLMAPDEELSLYRILQESLSNVVRHSGAATATVVLRRVHEQIELLIDDDGRGFDTTQSWTDDRGLGLLSMEERAAVMGGRLEIRSEPGRGTQVRVTVPILEEAIHDG
jgi:signal transduction histidine kinase